MSNRTEELERRIAELETQLGAKGVAGPAYPIEIVIRLGAFDTEGLKRLLEGVEKDFHAAISRGKLSVPDEITWSCAGPIGEYTVEVETRDITADEYRTELKAFRSESKP